MKKLLFILFVLFSNSLYCQTYNLCGVWFGYPYSCELPNQTEVIIITQIGNTVIASKYTGDSCVTKGSVTFFIPEYTQPTVTAYIIAGGPGSPNTNIGPISGMTIPDSTHINYGGWYANYTKATQLQIDSIGMNLDSLGVCCRNANYLLSQTYNLCGVWFGYPYSGGVTEQNLTEVIIITQIGQSVIASKFTGDSCVPKGSVTFFIPEYTQPTVTAYVISGGPGTPNAGIGAIYTMTIPDSTHIHYGGFLPNWWKATQLQIDSIGMNLDSLGVCCNGSVTGMKEEIKFDDMKLDVTPNPYTNTCMVIFKIKQGKLILTTLEGAQIKQYAVSGTSTLELNGEVLGGVSGTFMVSLISDDGKTLSKKVTFMK